MLSVSASTAILIYFTAYTGGFAQLYAMVGSLHKIWLLWALAVVLLSWVLDTMALHLLIRRIKKKQSIFSSLHTTIVGMLYCALTPFAVGGQPMQIAQMAGSGIESGNAVSIISMKSVVYQIGLTIYAILAVMGCLQLFLTGVPHFIAFTIFGLAANLLFIGSIIVMCVNEKLPGRFVRFITAKLAAIKLVKNPGKAYAAAHRQIRIFHDSFAIMRQSPYTLLGALLLTFIQLTTLYLVPFCIYKSFGLSGESLFYMIGANAIILMITAFIPLPGGSGAAEGSFYLFFSLFLAGPMVLPAIFLWRLFTYYSIILVGGATSAVMIMKKNMVGRLH